MKKHTEILLPKNAYNVKLYFVIMLFTVSCYMEYHK